MGHSSNGFLTIIRDHSGWSLMGKKIKEYIIKFLV